VIFAAPGQVYATRNAHKVSCCVILFSLFLLCSLFSCVCFSCLVLSFCASSSTPTENTNVLSISLFPFLFLSFFLCFFVSLFLSLFLSFFLSFFFYFLPFSRSSPLLLFLSSAEFFFSRLVLLIVWSGLVVPILFSSATFL